MGKVIMSGKVPKLTVPSNLPPVGTALANCSPEQIQAVARSGQASNYFSVGDTAPITLNGNVGALTFSNATYYAFILGFDHNSGIEGGNTIHFQFGKTEDGVDIAFYDGNNPGFCMNTTQTNSGGWQSSYMRNTICPAFKSAMPTAWQNVISPCTKYSDNTGGGANTASYVTATEDDIFLPAEFEVFGKRTSANSAEQNYQKQYDYYKAGNSKVKYMHNSAKIEWEWWLRSAYAFDNDSQRFCDVTGQGNALSSIANYCSTIAPCFMVA